MIRVTPWPCLFDHRAFDGRLLLIVILQNYLERDMVPDSICRVVGCVQDDWVLSPADSLPRATGLEISTYTIIEQMGHHKAAAVGGGMWSGTRLADTRPARDPRHSSCLAEKTAETGRELVWRIRSALEAFEKVVVYCTQEGAVYPGEGLLRRCMMHSSDEGM